MNRTLTNPCTPKPSDREALAVLDDDGNPWHPPEPDKVSQINWPQYAMGKLEAATAVLRKNSLLSMAIALGAGYVVARVIAARSS